MNRKIEQIINAKLIKHKKIKKIIKYIYQTLNVVIYRKSNYSKNPLFRPNSDESMLSFFGYYDKSPFNFDSSKLIYLKCEKKKVITPSSNDKIDIYLFNISDNTEKVISSSFAWNLQMGCRLQWLGPNFNDSIIFNSKINGKYVSIIKNVYSEEETVIDYPIYDVSNSGDFALTLNFEYLETLRPGYGYPKTKEIDFDIDTFCISVINLSNNTSDGLITYRELIEKQHDKTMVNAKHKVNHIMISPNDKKFMFLHRWITKNMKYTRLYVYDFESKKLDLINDSTMTSHSSWINDNEIITYASYGNDVGKEKTGYYIINIDNKIFSSVWQNLIGDGHPSYSKTLDEFVTDTYPDGKRNASIILCNNNDVIVRKRIPIRFSEDKRCDFHPRFDRIGKYVSFDSADSGERQLYFMKLFDNKGEV